MKVLIFNFVTVFVLFHQLAFQPKLILSDRLQAITQAKDNNQQSDAFARIIKIKGFEATKYIVTVKPTTTKIKAREVQYAKGKALILSVPVEITNSSSQPIILNLEDDRQGGIWAPTDLNIAVQKKDYKMNAFWDERPAYQVGNEDKFSKTRLKPGESITVEVRLNWGGTGSVPIEPLIDASAVGNYSIKFLLFFKTDVSKDYLVTQNFNIEVIK